jgi:hypothetical protein
MNYLGILLNNRKHEIRTLKDKMPFVYLHFEDPGVMEILKKQLVQYANQYGLTPSKYYTDGIVFQQ